MGREAASPIASASLRLFLPRLCERLDVLRWDQPHGVPQFLRNPAPVVGAATCFQHYLRGRGLAEERLEPSPGQILAKDRATVLINSVQGEDGLGRINGYTLKLHCGRLLCWTL